MFTKCFGEKYKDPHSPLSHLGHPSRKSRLKKALYTDVLAECSMIGIGQRDDLSSSSSIHARYPKTDTDLAGIKRPFG